MSKLKIFYILALIFFFATNPILSAQVIKEDFRVNDDTTGGDNINPDVEITESGETIIVWEDGRNGTANIFGQAYDNSGIAVDLNFKVSSYSAVTSEYSPAIASFGDSLLVVWRYGHGQWLLHDGSGERTSFQLPSGSMRNPDVAVSDSGFFVVWMVYLSNNYDIYTQRFNFEGDSISSRVLVNDDGTNENQYDPKIAIDNDGKFFVVWEDYRDGNCDIYGQLFNPAGNKIGSNFMIKYYVNLFQSNPSCAMDSGGTAVVVWEDNKDGNPNIYGRRFYVTGDTIAPLGVSFLINDNVEPYSQNNPSCAMDKSGNFMVVWEDYRDGICNVYAQRFDNTGSFIGNNFRINQSTGSYGYEPRISMNDSNFVVTWHNNRGLIYKRRFLNDGTPAGGEVKVNDVNGTENQEEPAIDMNNRGNVVITWFDYRNPPGIYSQRLNSSGDTVGRNFRIADGYQPDVAVAEDSSFVITYYWSSDIYYQRFSPCGDSIGSPAVISDTTYNYRGYPVIDLDSNKNAVVAWFDYRNGNEDVYAQIVNSAGDTVGGNLKVNDGIGTDSIQYRPAIAMAPSGRFLITWYDRRNGDYDIYGQVYDDEKNPIGSNFRIDSGGLNTQRNPDAGFLPNGNYIVVWEDFSYPSGIYAQIIDSMGTLVDTNFHVSDQSGYRPSVSVAPSGGFVVAWRDFFHEGDYNIYAQRYNSDFTPNSINYRVNNEIEGLNTDQDYPDVATDGNNIIFVWEDPKWHRGYDIAAKVFNWNQVGIEDAKTEGKGLAILGISSPILMGKEWLTISVDSPSEVDFKIINVAGIVVSSKKLNYAIPGIKKVIFDVSKLPSGPYFLSFKTKEGKAVKKTLVIR